MNGSENDPATFSSKEEEIKYWKEKAKDYKTRLEECQAEMEEYQTSSGELEAELEAELEQSQTRCSDLRHQLSRLATENDSLKERLTSQSSSLEGRVDSLEEELQGVRSIKEGLSNYIRELEQANDDLERAKRSTLTTLEDFEARLNQAIERNAFLESELDEKEGLKEMVQRLKDESRDLRQEVSLQRHRRPTVGSASDLSPGSTPDNDKAAALCVDSNKLQDATANNKSPPLGPSARMSALSIVGELLRKVGGLESRLASCRTLVQDNQRGSNGLPTDPSAR